MSASPIYLDCAATTPVDPVVADVMVGCLTQAGSFGNASSQHFYGWQAHEAIDQARESVAAMIGADSREVVFTSGATEANNIAIFGATKQYPGKHIITCATEHKAVLDPCQALTKQGYDVTVLPVQPNGLVDLERLKKELRGDTLLVSIMLVNNETGVVQDIAAIAEQVKACGALLHVDATQAAGKIAIDVNVLNTDLLSLSAHKMYGPKGAGCLYVRRQPRVRLQPLIFGGGHEQGIRPGTLATHQIVGFGKAAALVLEHFKDDSKRIAGLQKQFLNAVMALPDVKLNGHVSQRVPHIVNVSFAGVDGEALLLACHDLAIATGSACSSATIEPSHVLTAMGISRLLAHSSLRFSFGRYTTKDDVRRAADIIVNAVTRIRQVAGS